MLLAITTVLLFFSPVSYILYEIILIPIAIYQYALYIKDWRSGGELPVPKVVSLPIPENGAEIELGCKIGRDMDISNNKNDCLSKKAIINALCSIGATEVSNIEYAAYLFDIYGPRSLFDTSKENKINEQPIGLINRGYTLSDQFVSEAMPDFPMTNINLHQAQEYTAWLSQKTGRKFRLPTAEEWEIGARLTSTSKKYPWGNNSPYGYANCADCNWWSIVFFPLKKGVTSYEAYGGLHHMYGNVYEWTSTVSNDQIIKPGEEDDRPHQIVGGAYDSLSSTLTPISYHYINEKSRHPQVGFRICEDK